MTTSSLFSLDNLQREHQAWIKRNFPNADENQAFKGMVEELGELAHATLKQDQGIRGNWDDLEIDAKDAVGDLLIFTVAFCSARGWNVAEILQETWNEVSKRDWNKFPGNGLTK